LQSLKIIFMGTPDFAVPALNALIGSKHSVVAVFTQKPKPKGRGLEEQASPIHKIANINSIPVYTPETLRNVDIQNQIHSIEADIIVVVAYGFIIPKAILDSKKYGCLNIHPSLLPRFRGAAPLQRTIIAGDRESAVCIMQMDEGLDTGDILVKEHIYLHERITLLELHDKCSKIGAKLLIKTLNNIDNMPRIKQQKNGVVYASKLTKEEGIINWNETAFQIDCKVRGMTPWPGVFFTHNINQIKILETEYVMISHHYPPGVAIDNNLNIACKEGILKILKLQRPGKAPMSSEEFLKGYRIIAGEHLRPITDIK
jgi:methionyl-tRNA formyltransferase